MGSAEDMQHVYNYEDKNNEILNDKISAIVTPTRDSRNNKRKFELLQFEGKKQHAYIENNLIKYETIVSFY